MTITAKIIADSISPEGIRLTTLQCKYAKFVHGELLTHRKFSRNSSSSRAIPVERLIKDVMEDPVIPIHWGANQKGMQADQECNSRVLWHDSYDEPNNGSSLDAWLRARDYAVRMAHAFDDAGYHKQIVNRIIEPWCHINTVLSSTEWSNFFALRCHPAAQPEMRALADAIFKAMADSNPKLLMYRQWHLPYVRDEEKIDDIVAIKLSVARCARISYLTQEGKTPTIEEDLKLYDRLVGQVPLHASPCEHQATPDHPTVYKGEWMKPHLHGNFRGFIQFRKTLIGECQ
jgi:hypothetical protein